MEVVSRTGRKDRIYKPFFICLKMEAQFYVVFQNLSIPESMNSTESSCRYETNGDVDVRYNPPKDPRLSEYPEVKAYRPLSQNKAWCLYL